MKQHFLTASLAGLLCVVAAADASAWTRSATVNTTRGTYSASAAGGCAYGTCSRTKSVTGPNGNTVTRSGSVSAAPPYPYYGYPRGYAYSRTTTGPYGGTVSRSGTVVVTPY